MGNFGSDKRLDVCRFDNVQDTVDALDALQERWKNRLTSKDFGALGESYSASRLSLVCYFKPSIVLIGDQRKRVSCRDFGSYVTEDIVVLHVTKAHPAQLRHGDRGDDQVVLVEVVGPPDFPNQEVPSLVRFYFAKQQTNEPRETLNYATIAWRSLSRWGV